MTEERLMPSSPVQGDGRVVLITGATAGLGRHLAGRLATPDTVLLLHGRDPAALHDLSLRLKEKGATVHTYCADLASLDEVRDLGRRVVDEHRRIDVLINNAGVGPGAEGAGREASKEGHELRFAVGYLAPYVLTGLLLPALRCSAGARVINVGSAAQIELDHDDPEMTAYYDGWVAYGRAKLALASFSRDLADELKPSGIAVNCVHPADLMDTALVRDTGLAPQSTVTQGGDAVLALLRLPFTESGTGGYFNGLERAEPHEDVQDAVKRRRLHGMTERLLSGR
ncbi:SDR family NAD(P)-dependent oxidoreductase [Streptomyces sp. NBC_00727]|uniref:SDR family NAD(P)-dependent oxidoreductase n=1 Tax=Streptomyces sp. NBC_00727 TaxID=2903675 RepID=UPI003864C814